MGLLLAHRQSTKAKGSEHLHLGISPAYIFMLDPTVSALILFYQSLSRDDEVGEGQATHMWDGQMWTWLQTKCGSQRS